MNIPEYTWVCLDKLDSEYASGPKYAKYAKILNMVGFWIYEQYTCSEYVRKCLDRVLNISWVLNMPGFWTWQGSESTRVTQGSKYATISE